MFDTSKYGLGITGGKKPADMTEQELFDAVVKHLRTQRSACVDTYGCAYRDPTGRACAIGALISDQLMYEENIEPDSGSFPVICINSLAVREWFGIPYKDAVDALDFALRLPDLRAKTRANFLDALQQMHDGNVEAIHDDDEREVVFREFALHFCLTVPALET